ncbi:LytR C-terminal domain-containing protein [Dermatophilaceae bacterium Sec6.4]
MRTRGTVAIAAVVATCSLLVGCSAQPAPAKKSTCSTAGLPTPTVTIPASYIHLNVINASNTAGLAGKVATDLSWRGFKVIGTSTVSADNPRPVPKYAEIRYGTGGYQIALTLAAQVAHATLYDDGRTNPSIDLVLGSAFKLTALPPPAATTVTVNVYNTTPRAGLATDVAKEMRARGFKTDQVGNDPLGSFNPDLIAIVRYGARGEPAARRVALSVAGSKLVLDGRKDTSVDLVLSTKFKALVPAAQATAPAIPPPKRTCS